MALSGSALKSMMQAAFIADGRTWTDDIDASWSLICDVLITYLKANTVVTTTLAVASVSGVTPGSGVSGPGTGTGTGIIS